MDIAGSTNAFVPDVTRWGALTIGTGLDNARFTNRRRNRERAL
jgi:hypothetical protein